MIYQILSRLYLTTRVEAEKLPADFEVLILSQTPTNRGERIAIDDDSPWDEEVISKIKNTVYRWISAGKNVCLACDACVSRSPSAAIVYLMSVGMDLDEALEFVKARHPGARPSSVILESLMEQKI
ncbi:MAG: dual specificity protein phosphatase family protein [Candidatus Brocadiales bacterium]